MDLSKNKYSSEWRAENAEDFSSLVDQVVSSVKGQMKDVKASADAAVKSATRDKAMQDKVRAAAYERLRVISGSLWGR
jgi:hypothetical protein